MKKILLLITAIMMSAVMIAADRVTVRISDGIENVAVKQKMEQTISAILTDANAAYAAGRPLNYSAIGVPTSVQGSLRSLWDNCPFVSLDNEVVEHCITTGTGYQVRRIPLLLKPVNGEEIDKDEEYQEAVVSFDKRGNLVSFYLAISTNLVMNVLRDKSEVKDLRRRQLILDYVEQFRTSYNQRDINFLDAVFSEDALIITGKVIKRTTSDGIRLPEKIQYNKYTKNEYLTNLRRIFSLNKRLHVTFDEIEVVRHPTNPNMYGVTLHQGWTSDRYHDDGYLFMVWDFKDENHPKIHVRTWQPDAYNKDGNGTKRIPKDEIFSINDFEI